MASSGGANGHAADDLVFLEAKEDYLKPANPQLGLTFKKNAMFVLVNDHKSNICKDLPGRPKRKLLHFVFSRSGQYGFVPKKSVSVMKDRKLDWMTRDKFMTTVKESAGVKETPTLEKDWCIAINYYLPPPCTGDTELALEIGDKIRIKQKRDNGWYFGVCDGREGWFPKAYVQEAFVVDKNMQYTYQFTIEALKSYKSSDPNHLEFSFGDRLDVIQRPKTRDEYWVARDSDGKFGLIPKAYVEERLDLQTVLFRWQWYHSPCTREAAVRCLRPHKEMANHYLVRDSETYPGCFTICITTGVNSRILNIAVQTVPGGYRLNDKEFDTLEGLTAYYASHTIFDSDPLSLDGYQIYLRHPVRRPTND